MKNLIYRFVLLVTVVFCIQSFLFTNQADAFVSWSNSTGSATYFDWQNGGSNFGLFGDPTLVSGNTFLFTPENFIAISIDGEIGSASDTLSFDLIAHANVLITEIQISEYGDYGILDAGFVDAYSILQADNLVTFETESVNLITNPLMPIFSGTGEWTADGAVSFSGWTHLRVTLDNNLLTISDPGSVAFIQKKILGDSVAITIIPEPATIAALAAGMAFLRRKKH
ncbi:MAG: PEP-CTERM sorting domain-containing protein [Phycisphaerae bacterium]|jgi:hypothetical protein